MILADAIFFLLKNYDSSLPINVGTSKDISITELAIKNSSRDFRS